MNGPCPSQGGPECWWVTISPRDSILGACRTGWARHGGLQGRMGMVGKEQPGKGKTSTLPGNKLT